MEMRKMIRKFQKTLLLILVLLISVSLSACDLVGASLGSVFGAKGSDVLPCPGLKIGVLLDGEDPIIGQSQKRGYEQVLQEINDQGGVGGCPLELIYQDEGEPSDPEAARIAVRHLANEGVLAVIGATHSEATLNAAAIVDYFEVPLVIPSVSNDALLQDGNLWRFRVSPSNNSYAVLAFEMLSEITDGTLSMGILYEASNYGEDSAIAAANQALAHEFEVLYYQDFPVTNGDFSGGIEEINQMNPNILYIVSSNPEQAERILAEANLGLNGVNLIIGHGMGFCAQNFVGVPKSAYWRFSDELAYSCSWSSTTPLDSGTVDVEQPPFYDASAALELTAAAMEKAFSADPLWRLTLTDPLKVSEVRNLVAQSLRTNGFDLEIDGFGTVKFDGQGQNKAVPVMLQIIDGALNTVYPADKAEKDPVFIPGW
jgi:branched-chain amino acid transport system substrate-binding protein